MANGVKFDRKLKLLAFQRSEAIERRAAGEPLAGIAKSNAVSESIRCGAHSRRTCSPH
jgi:hypothetical protein